MRAGKRVVLTVNDFDQSSLNALTSNPAAATTLAKALIGAIEAKNFDGVNLDLEGSGSADQAGLTALVTTVSNTLHLVDPHWQVTMDTYASSAGDPSGFYDISALASVVDAFFVMEYSPNVAAPAQASSPLTSSLFSDLTTAAAVRRRRTGRQGDFGRALLRRGLADHWQHTQRHRDRSGDDAGRQPDHESGHPLYWDPVTDTAWTAYQVGAQWHEAFFDDPTSLYQIAHLADQDGLRGVGAWALGMEGTDPAMVSALNGVAPAIHYAAPPAPSTTQPTDDHRLPAAAAVRAPRPRPADHHDERSHDVRPSSAPAPSIVGTFEAETLATIARRRHGRRQPRRPRASPSAWWRLRRSPNAGCAAPLPPPASVSTSTTEPTGAESAISRSHRGRLAQRVGGAERSRPQLPRQCQPIGRARCIVSRHYDAGAGGVAMARQPAVRLRRSATPQARPRPDCANATLAFPVPSATSAAASGTS